MLFILCCTFKVNAKMFEALLFDDITETMCTLSYDKTGPRLKFLQEFSIVYLLLPLSGH